jgi:hypothetical protein
VVFDEENGDFELVAHAFDGLSKFVDLGMGEAGRGFVEEQQPRVAGESTGQFEAFQGAERQARCTPVGEVGEAERVQDPVGVKRQLVLLAAGAQPEDAAVNVFSIKVMDGNRARFWKVRATPRPATRYAGTERRGCPSRRTLPLFG